MLSRILARLKVYFIDYSAIIPKNVIQMHLLLIYSLQVSFNTILKVKILNPFKTNDVEHRNCFNTCKLEK